MAGHPQRRGGVCWFRRRVPDALFAQMTLAELKAAAAWLERNRLAEHAHLLEDDPRYAWTVRQRTGWAPSVGRVPKAGARQKGQA